MTKKTLAFVLGGGGARGALQVGSLRALIEAGYRPQLLVGTSVGAVNATYLAIHGLDMSAIDNLVQAWHEAVQAELMPSNYLWLTLRTLFNRSESATQHRMREFFLAHGVSPTLRFQDIHRVKLITVAVDLNSGRVVPYGVNHQDFVLEGVLASTALPPWVQPLRRDNLMLMDGGVASNLPIEIALSQGASEIIALDLSDPRREGVQISGFGPFLLKLLQTVEQRQTEVEMALAEARKVPVHRICLCGERQVPMWDFQYTEELIAHGYQVTCQAIEGWRKGRRTIRMPAWLRILRK